VKSLWTGPSHHDVISAKSQRGHMGTLMLKLTSHCGPDQRSSRAGFGSSRAGFGPLSGLCLPL